MDATESPAAEPAQGPTVTRGFDPADESERAAARRASGPPRNLGLLRAFGMVLVAAVALSLALFTSPVNLARTFGSTVKYQATVDSVQLTRDRPCRRRHKPQWTVQLHWESPDGLRSTTFTESSCGKPYDIGQVVPIYGAEGSPGITVSKYGPVGIWFGFGSCLAALVTALAMIRNVRRWPQLRRQLGSAPTVLGTVEVSSRRTGKNEDAGRGSVGIDSVELPAGGKQFDLWARDDKRLPQVGEKIQLWSLDPTFSGPTLLRTERDGRWWSGES